MVTLAESHVVLVGEGMLGTAVRAALVAEGVGTVAVVAADDFGPGTSFDLLLEADLIIDASDDPATRYHANDAASVRGIPLVWGSTSGSAAQVGVAWDEAGVDYRDFAPDEASATAGPAGDDAVAATIAPVMVAEAIKLLTGEGEPLLGRVLEFDATTGGTREISYARDADAARPGSIEERTTIPEPDAARSVTPTDLARLLAGPTTRGIHETPPLLLDVRERPEASFVSLADSVLIPLGELPNRLDELDSAVGGRDAPIVVYCHHGVRSARALDVLEKAGFTHVRHLTGGIDAYAQDADTSLPRY